MDAQALTLLEKITTLTEDGTPVSLRTVIDEMAAIGIPSISDLLDELVAQQLVRTYDDGTLGMFGQDGGVILLNLSNGKKVMLPGVTVGHNTMDPEEILRKIEALYLNVRKYDGLNDVAITPDGTVHDIHIGWRHLRDGETIQGAIDGWVPNGEILVGFSGEGV